MSDVEVKLGFDCLKVYFGDVMHLRIKLSELLGVQSWRQGDNNYFIEYTLDRHCITTEYDCPVKWKTILSRIDDLL